MEKYYIKPQMEIIEINLEQSILTYSTEMVDIFDDNDVDDSDR